ncbi:MAG: NfeD family protein [Deltaproteobacteria bacterium]|nr:NfeD family protein [Deltaproteobacteria bacterium]
MKEILITLLVCVVIYEIVEHILLPLFWTIRYRGRQSAYGPSGMIGKRCVVKQWTGTRGKVWVGGELWNATGNSSLMPEDEGLIQGIDNLTLLVVPLIETIDTPNENLAEDRSTKL